MPNKNRSFHEAPEKAGGEGWLYSEQQQKVVQFKPDASTVHAEWVALVESLGRGEPGDWLFPSNKRNGPLTRQAVAARMAMWGREANVRLHPHRCRHTHATHAIRRGVDVFTLSATLGHSSTGTTSHYVLAEPGESSSLKLG
jgi:site-specific recombinase XerD